MELIFKITFAFLLGSAAFRMTSDYNFVSPITYYIDSVGGNDANAGTSTGAAWRTVSKVNTNTAVTSSDTIRFKNGQTWAGTTLNPSHAPAYIGGYGVGAPYTITGAINITTWTNFGGG